MKMGLAHKFVIAAAVFASVSVAMAQDGVDWAAAEPTPSYMKSQPLPGVVYNEYQAYSTHVKRSYVPAFTPAISSQYLNPRSYPAALGAMATPYTRYGAVPGWHFGIPCGYTSGGEPGSPALSYVRGENNITTYLSRGYPDGQRVVEPVIVPYSPGARSSGYLIMGSPTALTVVPPAPLPAAGSCNSNTGGSYATAFDK
ncbi:MAG: hypothetical protein K1X53_05630 [Candidatus Sumerlaeaceae bacterium]|nr:hypothetical protein [Candidatus Sumerlaeaceae bacterium]